MMGTVKRWFGAGEEAPVTVVTDEQVIREAIYNDFKRIIVACLHCWNDLPIFAHKDFTFTRTGVFPYTNDDEKAMEKIMEFSFIKFKEQLNMHLMQDVSRASMRETLAP